MFRLLFGLVKLGAVCGALVVGAFIGLVAAEVGWPEVFAVVDGARHRTVDGVQAQLEKRARETYEVRRRQAVERAAGVSDAIVDAAAGRLKAEVDEAAADAKADLREELDDVGRLEGPAENDQRRLPQGPSEPLASR